MSDQNIERSTETNEGQEKRGCGFLAIIICATIAMLVIGAIYFALDFLVSHFIAK